MVVTSKETEFIEMLRSKLVQKSIDPKSLGVTGESVDLLLVARRLWDAAKANPKHEDAGLLYIYFMYAALAAAEKEIEHLDLTEEEVESVALQSLVPYAEQLWQEAEANLVDAEMQHIPQLRSLLGTTHLTLGHMKRMDADFVGLHVRSIVIPAVIHWASRNADPEQDKEDWIREYAAGFEISIDEARPEAEKEWSHRDERILYEFNRAEVLVSRKLFNFDNEKGRRFVGDVLQKERLSPSTPIDGAHWKTIEEILARRPPI